MRKTIVSIIVGALLAGCTSTIPSTGSAPTIRTPEQIQVPEKYALQAILIEVEVPALAPENITSISDYSAFSEGPDELFKTPGAVVTEYPIVYAAVGETAVNDQTETVAAPRTYSIITNTAGQLDVAYSKETTQVGFYSEMTVQFADNGSATCAVKFSQNKCIGMPEHEAVPATENQKAVTASMPIFQGTGVETEIALAPGYWLAMGGCTHESIKDFNTGTAEKTRTKTLTAIRLIPPKGIPFDSGKTTHNRTSNQRALFVPAVRFSE